MHRRKLKGGRRRYDLAAAEEHRSYLQKQISSSVMLRFFALFSHPYVLARIIHEASTAAVDPDMSTALRSVGLLDVLLSLLQLII
jgi:hypothetical protein